MEFEVAVQTRNDLNTRQHWRPVARRAKVQRHTTRLTALTMFAEFGKPALPCEVLLTRVSRGTLDDDAVPGALKHVRDGIADALGVDDRNSHIVRYRYAQERGPAPLVRVEIRPMEAP